MVRYISNSFWRRKINEKLFWTVITFTPSLHHYYFNFENVVTVFSSDCYFWMLSSTFNFQYFLLANTILNWTYYYCLSTIDGFVVFHYAGEFCFFLKSLALFTLINQHMQMLSWRGVLPNEFSPNVQKFVEKNMSLSDFVFANFELIRKSLWSSKFSLGWFVKVHLRQF